MVLFYTHPTCPHSAAARRDFETRGVDVREVDLAAQPESIPEFLKLTGGRRIVPVIVDGGRILVAPDGGTEF